MWGGRTPNGKCHLKFPFWFFAPLPYEETLRITNDGYPTREYKTFNSPKILFPSPAPPPFLAADQLLLAFCWNWIDCFLDCPPQQHKYISREETIFMQNCWILANVNWIDFYCTLHLYSINTVQYNTLKLFINIKKKNDAKLLNFSKRRMQLGGALWNGPQFHFYVFKARYSASRQIHAKGQRKDILWSWCGWGARNCS